MALQQIIPLLFNAHRQKEPLSFINHLFNRRKLITIKDTAVQAWKITLTSMLKLIKRQFHNNRIPHNRHQHINHLNMLTQARTFIHLMISSEQVLPLNKVTNILNHKTKDASHQITLRIYYALIQMQHNHSLQVITINKTKTPNNKKKPKDLTLHPTLLLLKDSHRFHRITSMEVSKQT